MNTTTQGVPEIYVWQWDMPYEKEREVMLICGDGPCRIRSILESTFQITYKKDLNCAGRLEIFQKKNKICYVVILLCDWQNTNSQIAVLSHEVNHLIFSHFKDRGYHIPLVDNHTNDEELFNGQQEYWLFTMLSQLNEKDKSKYLYFFSNEHEEINRSQKPHSGRISELDLGQMRRDQSLASIKKPQVWEQRLESQGNLLKKSFS